MMHELTSGGYGLYLGLALGALLGFLGAALWRGKIALAGHGHLVQRQLVGVVRSLLDLTSSLHARLSALDDDFAGPVLDCRPKSGEDARSVSQYLNEVRGRLEHEVETLETQGRLLHVDPGTGLADRAAFMGLLDQCLQQGIADDTTSVMALTIDGLFQIASQYGRRTSENAARIMAEALAETLRAKDVVGRFDDQQFVVLLPATRLADGQLAAARIKRAVAAHSIEIGDKPLALTLSIGVVGVMQADDSSAVIERARQAMLSARSSGGNNIHVHDGVRCQAIDESVLSTAHHQLIDLRALPEPDMLAPQLAAIGVDAVTGLPNRQSFDEALQSQVDSCTNTSQTFSLMLVKIENLEHFHREYGVIAGDALLRVITQVIRSTTRASFDQFGLYEHDTIGVLLAGANQTNAAQSVERLAKALDRCRLRDEGRDLTIHATVIAAELPTGGDGRSVMEAAETALRSANCPSHAGVLANAAGVLANA